MPRVRGGTRAVQRRKKVMRLAKGQRGARSRLYKSAVEAVDHALQHAYRDRRNRKRDMRRLWITRINAAARLHGLSYSCFMSGLKGAGIVVNRKVLASMAVTDPATFASLTRHVREAVQE